MKNILNIKTDYRIELFSLIAFLSKLDEKRAIDRSENSYTNLLNENFTQFSDHQAVIEFPKMWNRGLCYDAIPFLLFHLDDDFILMEELEFSERLKIRYDGDSQDLIKYLDLVRDFASQTKFQKFYESNLDNEFFTEVNAKAAEYPIIDILENYLNLQLSASKVVLSTLFFSSFGITIESQNSKQIYCVMSGTMLKLSRQHSDRYFSSNLLAIIWHEFLHSIVNPLSDQLFDNPLTMSDAQVRWYCKLNESIIWALTFRLLLSENLVSTKDGEWYFSNAEKNGAPKAKAMNDLLIEYENDKAKYKNFEIFYPVLQRAFGQRPY